MIFALCLNDILGMNIRHFVCKKPILSIYGLLNVIKPILVSILNYNKVFLTSRYLITISNYKALSIIMT
jgi:hypothetical protein